MTSPLGCMRDARAALDGQLNRIGAGGYRYVYEDSRGRFVYKVARMGVDEDDVNIDEHEASEAARRDGVPGIPRTYLWYVDDRVVLCMRKYPEPNWSENQFTKLVNDTLRVWERAGFGDLHYGNFTVTKSGQPRLLDMQSYV